jgi:hypothetical protein
VCEKVSPSLRLSDSNEPLSAVTVWGNSSPFVHFTVSPTVTLSVFGEKAKSAIAASVVAAAAGAIGVRAAAMARTVRSFVVARMPVLRMGGSPGSH